MKIGMGWYISKNYIVDVEYATLFTILDWLQSVQSVCYALICCVQ